MPPTNDILTFAPTDTGTNVLDQADYSVAADRNAGNQPGIASSKLVNKAARQAALIASQIAQLVCNNTGLDMLDVDGGESAILAALKACFTPTGLIQMWGGTTAPAGWLPLQGGTIGDGTSGGTARSNADTAALFAFLWNQYNNTILPIQDSAGAGTTRGVSAAADFAAHKRMPLQNIAGLFPRGAGTQTIGGLAYAATAGVVTRDSMQKHGHDSTQQFFGTHPGGVLQNAGGNVIYETVTVGDPIDSGSGAGTPRVGNETKPAELGLLFIIKI